MTYKEVIEKDQDLEKLVTGSFPRTKGDSRLIDMLVSGINDMHLVDSICKDPRLARLGYTQTQVAKFYLDLRLEKRT